MILEDIFEIQLEAIEFDSFTIYYHIRGKSNLIKFIKQCQFKINTIYKCDWGSDGLLAPTSPYIEDDLRKYFGVKEY